MFFAINDVIVTSVRATGFATDRADSYHALTV